VDANLQIQDNNHATVKQGLELVHHQPVVVSVKMAGLPVVVMLGLDVEQVPVEALVYVPLKNVMDLIQNGFLVFQVQVIVVLEFLGLKEI
jgi:hypothetical protein